MFCNYKTFLEPDSSDKTEDTDDIPTVLSSNKNAKGKKSNKFKDPVACSYGKCKVSFQLHI